MLGGEVKNDKEIDKVPKSEEEENYFAEKHDDATKHAEMQDNIRMQVPYKRFMDMKVDIVEVCDICGKEFWPASQVLYST